MEWESFTDRHVFSTKRIKGRVNRGGATKVETDKVIAFAAKKMGDPHFQFDHGAVTPGVATTAGARARARARALLSCESTCSLANFCEANCTWVCPFFSFFPARPVFVALFLGGVAFFVFFWGGGEGHAQGSTSLIGMLNWFSNTWFLDNDLSLGLIL